MRVNPHCVLCVDILASLAWLYALVALRWHLRVHLLVPATVCKHGRHWRYRCSRRGGCSGTRVLSRRFATFPWHAHSRTRTPSCSIILSPPLIISSFHHFLICSVDITLFTIDCPFHFRGRMMGIHFRGRMVGRGLRAPSITLAVVTMSRCLALSLSLALMILNRLNF